MSAHPVLPAGDKGGDTLSADSPDYAQLDAIWFEQLYTTCFSWVRKVIIRRLPATQRDHALDIAQEVFSAAWAYRDRIPHDDPLPWLFTTAYHRLQNFHRKHKAIPMSTEALDVLIDSGDRPTLQLETTLDVRRAIAGLRKAERDLIVMRYFDELSHRQMAEILGILEPACRKRVCRAGEALRARLGNAYETFDLASITRRTA